MTARLLKSGAAGLFASAVLHGNTFVEQSNVFVANLLGFDANSFIAIPVDGVTPYGVMIANTAHRHRQRCGALRRRGDPALRRTRSEAALAGQPTRSSSRLTP